MTVTYSLTTSYLTADIESGQHIFLWHLTEVSTALMHIFQNKSLISEKN